MKIKDILLAIPTFFLAFNRVISADTANQDSSLSWGFCNQLITDRTEGFLAYDEFYTAEHLEEYTSVYKCINHASKESEFFDNLAGCFEQPLQTAWSKYNQGF